MSTKISDTLSSWANVSQNLFSLNLSSVTPSSNPTGNSPFSISIKDIETHVDIMTLVKGKEAVVITISTGRFGVIRREAFSHETTNLDDVGVIDQTLKCIKERVLSSKEGDFKIVDLGFSYTDLEVRVKEDLTLNVYDSYERQGLELFLGKEGFSSPFSITPIYKKAISKENLLKNIDYIIKSINDFVNEE